MQDRPLSIPKPKFDKNQDNKLDIRNILGKRLSEGRRYVKSTVKQRPADSRRPVIDPSAKAKDLINGKVRNNNYITIGDETLP